LADRFIWPTVLFGRPFYLADRFIWPTVLFGRPRVY
jgi:hypothetical protein